MQILVMTSAKYHHLLPGFCYMFNEYWGERAVIATDTRIEQELPDNFAVHSYSGWKPLPASRWSGGLRRALKSMEDTLVTILLEDYYLIEPVKKDIIEQCIELYEGYPDTLLRFDLTNDRRYNGAAIDRGRYGDIELVETLSGSEYQMSFQAGIWNRLLMLSLVPPGANPWLTEIGLQPPPTMKVFGTKQEPVIYANIARSGGESVVYTYDEIPEHNMKVLIEKGWTA